VADVRPFDDDDSFVGPNPVVHLAISDINRHDFIHAHLEQTVGESTG